METFDVSISFLEEYFLHPMFERVKNACFLLVEQRELFQVGCLSIEKTPGGYLSQSVVTRSVKRVLANSNCCSKPSKFARRQDTGVNENLEATEIEIVSAVQEVTSGPKKAFACELCSYRSHTRAAVRKHILMTHSPNCPRYHSIPRS